MMIGCSVCGEVIMTCEDLSGEEVEYYICPSCKEEGKETE